MLGYFAKCIYISADLAKYVVIDSYVKKEYDTPIYPYPTDKNRIRNYRKYGYFLQFLIEYLQYLVS